MKNIIVVGGNAAGPAAAAKAKRTDKNANVILIEASPFISTGTCEMPFILGGKIDDYRKVVFFDEKSFYEKKGVKVYAKHTVEKINPRAKTIYARNSENDELIEFEYDKLILTTGSVPKKIPALAEGYDNLFYLKSIPNLIQIIEYLKNHETKNALIIGAGYIGLETAEAFVERGMNVTVVELEELPLPGAEPEIRNLALEELKEKGVRFFGGIPYEFLFSGRRIKGIKIEGRILEFDIVLSAIGVKPNNKLAEEAGLELGRFGGLKTDAKQRTSDWNIYAAGDNAEIVNAVTGKADYFPIATIAYSQSHVAGANAAGGNEFSLPVVPNIAVKIFSKNYASAGLTEAKAKEHFTAVHSVSSIALNIIKVMPGSEKVYGKLVFETETKRILGASFWGAKQVAAYADLISALIRAKADYRILADIDFNYTPPLSPFVNLLSILGKKAKDV
jgi:NADPH-dependent 2,4-dienoyl-CoA reductase/sulfur reductase-like enzyme